MRIEKIVLLVTVVGFAGLAGCADQADQSVEVGQTAAAAKGGCRWECPKCKPNRPCAAGPCVYVCHPQSTVCGDNVCTKKEVCCNESCGICTPPDGFCTMQYCVSTNGCQTDADCRTYSNYCDGCACDALTVNELDPVCLGAIVQCFADPCRNQIAVCDQSTAQCVLAAP